MGLTITQKRWDLILGDMRELVVEIHQEPMIPDIDLLITDVPNLPDMPISEIENGLNRLRPKKAVICADDKLNLEYPFLQFSHDDYGKYPLYFTCSNIFLHTEEDDLVFDPFCGYSTTGVCALDMGRRYYGVERNSEIYEISLKRLNQFYAEKYEISSKRLNQFYAEKL